MQKLNFSDYSFRFKNSENKVSVFDEIRKKFIVLTPEEWVRIHVVQFLIQEKNYPKSLINVEKLIRINTIIKRNDIEDNQPNREIIISCDLDSDHITFEVYHLLSLNQALISSDNRLIPLLSNR